MLLNNLQPESQNLKQSSRKKRKFWLVLVGIGLIILIVGYLKRGSLFGDSSSEKNSTKQENSGTNTLVEQYKSELPELKEKAENNDPSALQDYAVAQYATGDIAGAEETYRKQVEVDGNNVLAHNNLGNSLRDQGKFDEAIKEYRTAIKLDPKALTSYTNLSNVYQFSLNKKDEAVKVYQEAIIHNPDSVELYILLGMTYEGLHDKDNARNNFQKASEMQPENQAAKAGLKRVE